MRIITVDIGNTNPNVGIFENDQLTKVVPLDIFESEPNDISICCSVNDNIKFNAHFNLKNYRLEKSFFSMPVDYSMTLGMDRLVAAYKAYLDFKTKNDFKAIVIDAGTFITIDTLSTAGFEGGYIFPGIKIFLNSYAQGNQLLALDFELKKLDLLPKNTNDAIMMAGNAYLKSILIETIKNASPSNLIITGGSGETILNVLKEINLEVEPQLHRHFLHQAMHLIYHRHLKDLKAL